MPNNAKATWNGDKLTLEIDTSLSAGMSESGKNEKIAFSSGRGEYIHSPSGESFLLMLQLLKPIGTVAKSDVTFSKRK